MPKTSRKKVKNRAWGWFSKYIRLRDCMNNKSTTRAKCITCKVEFDFKELQAGHCIGGRNDSILFDEKLVNAQCSRCNRPVFMGGKGGAYPEYSLWYIEKYGIKDFEEKIKLSNEIRKYTLEELEEISDSYRIKFNELKKWEIR